MANDYWRRRAIADRRLAARSQQVVEREIKQALRREYLRTAKNLESLYAEVQSRGELSRTKLWNYRGWRDTAAELEQFCETGSVIERDAITKCLDKVFEDVIGAPVEEFDRSKFVVRFNPRAIIDTNWSGDNYSSRIWKHNQALAERIRIMAEQVVTGTVASGDLYRQLQREFNVTYAQAKRLVDTEISYVLNRACIERYRAYGVQKVEILNLDVNTCKRCEELEGRVFYLDDAPVLPIHPNCHCTYVVPVDGDDAPITLAGDLTRKEKTDTIQSETWYDKHIAGNAEKEAKYEEVLRKAKESSRLDGEFSKPVIPADLSSYTFDDNHINIEREHRVSREEAESYVRDAVLMVSRNDGRYVNYYGMDGSTYTIPRQKKLRTAFKARQYTRNIIAMIEVMKYEFGIESAGASEILPFVSKKD